MKVRRGIAVLGIFAALGLPFAASPAFASDESAESETVVVNGREFGPEDGVTVTEETFVIEPGSGETVGEQWATTPAPGTVSPMAAWGASYATSTEIAQLAYLGKAKAAANVYNGQRIIKVCFSYWWGQSNRTGWQCSSASSNGSQWTAGAEKSYTFWDNLSINWPQTVFHIQTTRINPQIF